MYYHLTVLTYTLWVTGSKNFTGSFVWVQNLFVKIKFGSLKIRETETLAV